MQSPGTYNLRCLGIPKKMFIINHKKSRKLKKKKKRIDKGDKPQEVPKGLNNSIQKKGFFTKEVLRIFQWIKYSHCSH